MENNQTNSFSHDDHTLIIASDPNLPEDMQVELQLGSISRLAVQPTTAIS